VTEKNLKILIGMPAPDSWGGPASSEPPFTAALRALGVNVTEEVYVYGDKEKPTAPKERVRRVLKTAFRFRRVLRRERFDIVHLNTAFDLKTILRDAFSLFVMNPKKTRIFLKLHGSEAQDFVQTNFFVRLLIRYIGRRADGFGIHTTDELKNFEALGFDKNKFFFVKNAVTIHERLPDGFARAQKRSDETFELLYTGRFVPKKCLIETIEACRILREKGCRFVLYCVGDGPERLPAERLVEKYALKENVVFTGYVAEEKANEHFFKRDVLIFPTLYGEGFPNVFFKAVAVGMPIVATPFRAARDFLAEGENYLACTAEPESIAEKIFELIENGKLRAAMSENNLKFGRRLLPENAAREFLEIYREILNKD
jgi:glycosyltransferase involved in cell wall biosynthesis